MKKICVVTSARSEYGPLQWIIKDIDRSIDFELQLVVTGGHLLYEQGHTIDQICLLYTSYILMIIKNMVSFFILIWLFQYS